MFLFLLFKETAPSLIALSTNGFRRSSSLWSEVTPFLTALLPFIPLLTSSYAGMMLPAVVCRYFEDNLPSDLVPPADFDTPVSASDNGQDSSSTAIVASTLLEISVETGACYMTIRSPGCTVNPSKPRRVTVERPADLSRRGSKAELTLVCFGKQGLACVRLPLLTTRALLLKYLAKYCTALVLPSTSTFEFFTLE